MNNNLIDFEDFQNWIDEIKSEIKSTQLKVSINLNESLMRLYWNLGEKIVLKQSSTNWGSSFIDKISSELKSEFPHIKGFSKRNLYAIRQWFLFYSQEFEFVPQAVAQIPWGHNRLIISKIKDINVCLFYANETVLNGWSRDFLQIQIENGLINRKGKSISNFEKTLPNKQSEYAQQTLKDPYNFDFLGIGYEAQEREIELELTKHITNFLLELGKGFAFVGKQYNIQVSNNNYYIDLLFYHIDLKSYIVIELKSGKFKPEYAGKLNFYLSAVDSQLKKSSDNTSIGLILCRTKDRIEAEYSLRDINKPIGISSYSLTNAIPENIKTKLPTINEIEEELSKDSHYPKAPLSD